MPADSAETNRYTEQWFATFLETVPGERTEAELDAITHHLPRDRFPRMLDVGCGNGRLALPLVDLGYDVTGVDRDRRQLDVARDRLGERQARFIAIDLRDLSLLRGSFDGVLSVWQSFGYFEPTINDAILNDMADLLRRGGRLAFDLYHPEYWLAHQGTREDDRSGVRTITQHVHDGRLRSEIAYEDGNNEAMDFELIHPDDLVRRSEKVDLELVAACAGWDATSPPSPDVARYQMVFERS